MKRERDGLMRTFILFLVVGSSLAVSAQSESAAKSKSINPPFALSISSEPVFTLGSPVEVRIRITNTSTHEIHGSAMNVDGFAISYTYDVHDQSGNKLEQKPFDQTRPGGGPIFTLKPGESRGDLTRLNEAYDFSPGKYTIQLSKPLSDEPGADVVKSNKITITITP
jgi:hypothetical protein